MTTPSEVTQIIQDLRRVNLDDLETKEVEDLYAVVRDMFFDTANELDDRHKKGSTMIATTRKALGKFKMKFFPKPTMPCQECKSIPQWKLDEAGAALICDCSHPKATVKEPAKPSSKKQAAKAIEKYDDRQCAEPVLSAMWQALVDANMNPIPLWNEKPWGISLGNFKRPQNKNITANIRQACIDCDLDVQDIARKALSTLQNDTDEATHG